jgi:hypothetical protein
MVGLLCRVCANAKRHLIDSTTPDKLNHSHMEGGKNAPRPWG